MKIKKPVSLSITPKIHAQVFVMGSNVGNAVNLDNSILDISTSVAANSVNVDVILGDDWGTKSET